MSSGNVNDAVAVVYILGENVLRQMSFSIYLSLVKSMRKLFRVACEYISVRHKSKG